MKQNFFLFTEGFDFETFKKLEPRHLRELIPSPRYRILFEIKFSELIKKCDGTDISFEATEIDRAVNVDAIFDDNLAITSEEVDEPKDVTFTIVNSINPPIIEDESETILVNIPSTSKSIARPSHDSATPVAYSKISESEVFYWMRMICSPLY